MGKDVINMDVIAVALMSIGLILAPVIGFFYPAWLRMKGEEVSEKKLYGIRAAAHVCVNAGNKVMRGG